MSAFKVMIKVFLIMSSIVCANAYADTYTFDIQANGIQKADIDTISDLIQMNFKSEFGKIHQLTSNEKATYRLKTKILKLDNLYIINIEKEKDNHFIFSASIKSPKTDELDQKISKLLRAVVKEQMIIEKVGETTESEKTEKSIRRQSVNRWYIGFGPAASSNLKSTVTMTNFTFGYNWEVNSQASIRAFYDFINEPGSNRNASFVNLGLGLQYFLNEDNNAPYVLGDLGRATATSSSSEEVAGFSFGIGVGYTLFRTSSTNFDLQMKAQTLSTSNKNGRPSTFGFRIGILF